MNDLLKEGQDIQLQLREAERKYARAEAKLIEAQKAKQAWDNKLWTSATVEASKAKSTKLDAFRNAIKDQS